MIRKLMLVSDRSESADRAAQVAGELATTFGAEVLVIYVMMPLPVLVKMAGEANDRFYGAGSMAGLRGLEQAGEETLAHTVKILEQMGIHPKARLERGHPAVRICELAGAEMVDLIVMGSQAVRKATALYEESASEQVSQCAICSVMVGA